ncbi:Ldh family oxidoreductase [Roseomonas populi]|uniref:Ldh family oxidoreductase n=1 Tax=Roseomonas populi TaxID=3121582 RepID=A0ABT1XAM4_9PROT|nr:Ldh family oxidoreductase [Roseomonas pecuniae]MCR0985151.1 Ldh family oxidoreductase [Roseomonas pecuniae]
MTDAGSARRIPAERVHAQIVAVLTAWTMPKEAIRVTADAMLATDLSGVDSHGISMLMEYERARKLGKLNVAARPRVVRETPVTALVDADAGMGHPAAVMGMELALKKARLSGLAAVCVNNSHHFGAAGYYAGLAVRQGMIGLVTSATRNIAVVPTRAAVPLLGTNPLAFAAPAGRNNPFLLDMATSTVASNKVKVHDLQGKPLPPGWVLDEKGEPVVDAAEGFDILYHRDTGGLTPLGGVEAMASYKGYGLAMMVHILGGTLSGASFSPIRNRTQRPEQPDNLGHFFLAMDPDAFRDDGGFEADLDDAIDVLHAAQPADPERPVLVPGDPEAATRAERRRDGIPLPDALIEKLRGVCQSCGAPFLLLD